MFERTFDASASWIARPERTRRLPMAALAVAFGTLLALAGPRFGAVGQYYQALDADCLIALDATDNRAAAFAPGDQLTLLGDPAPGAFCGQPGATVTLSIGQIVLAVVKTDSGGGYETDLITMPAGVAIGAQTIRAVTTLNGTTVMYTLSITVKTTTIGPDGTTFRGTGPRSTGQFELTSGMTRFRSKHDGRGAFTVTLIRPGEDEPALLVEEGGAYEGSTGFGFGAGTYMLTVQADGNWTVTVDQPSSATGRAPPFSFSGTEDAVEGPLEFGTGTATFTITHDGFGNFVALLLDDGGAPHTLLADEVGPFETQVVAEVGSVFWLVVDAESPWTISGTGPVPGTVSEPVVEPAVLAAPEPLGTDAATTTSSAPLPRSGVAASTLALIAAALIVGGLALIVGERAPGTLVPTEVWWENPATQHRPA